MRRFLYSALLLAFTSLGVAQETPLEAGLEATYNESVDLFEDGLYAAARVGFDELLESDLPTQSFLKEESSFYRALVGNNLFLSCKIFGRLTYHLKHFLTLVTELNSHMI